MPIMFCLILFCIALNLYYRMRENPVDTEERNKASISDLSLYADLSVSEQLERVCTEYLKKFRNAEESKLQNDMSSTALQLKINYSCQVFRVIKCNTRNLLKSILKVIRLRDPILELFQLMSGCIAIYIHNREPPWSLNFFLTQSAN